MRKKKQKDETTEEPKLLSGRRKLIMTKADWEKVADANARAEKSPDPAQIILTDIVS